MTLLASLIASSQKRRMYRSLLQLDDHLLRDIGLNRYALREQISARRPMTIDTHL